MTLSIPESSSIKAKMAPLHAKWFLLGFVVMTVYLTIITDPVMCQDKTTTAKPSKAPKGSKSTKSSTTTSTSAPNSSTSTTTTTTTTAKPDDKSINDLPGSGDDINIGRDMGDLPDYSVIGGGVADLPKEADIFKEVMDGIPLPFARSPSDPQQVDNEEKPLYPNLIDSKIRLEYVPNPEAKNTFRHMEALRMFRDDWAKGQVQVD